LYIQQKDIKSIFDPQLQHSELLRIYYPKFEHKPYFEHM